MSYVLKHPRWKVSLWSHDTVDPAMLRVPIIIMIFIMLWGVNVWMFEKLRLPYHGALSMKTTNLSFIFFTAIISISFYAFSITALHAFNWSIESGITFFYITLFISYFVPGLPGKEARTSFFRLMKICFVPGNSISFPEILLTDALTSISKLLKDFSITLFAVYAYFTGTDVILLHDNAMILVALMAALPFWLRVRQCWVQIEGCSDSIARIPPILNLIKYTTAFPPILMTAAGSLGYHHPKLSMAMTTAAFINSSYSYCWDIVQDWGMIQLKRDLRLYPRSRMYFPVYMYIIAAVINLIMRFSWLINRVPFFADFHPSVIILIIEIGEVCRRSMWNILRVEWEIVVQQERGELKIGVSEDQELEMSRLLSAYSPSNTLPNSPSPKRMPFTSNNSLVQVATRSNSS